MCSVSDISARTLLVGREIPPTVSLKSRRRWVCMFAKRRLFYFVVLPFILATMTYQLVYVPQKGW